MSITLADKASRAVRLLFGMRNPAIARALARYGFTEAVIQEGWRVLRDASAVRVAPMGRPPGVSASTLALLEAWQREWFSVVELALTAKHPELCDLVFAGLSRKAGPECALHVASFLQRVEAMFAGEEPFGEAGAAARATLMARGFQQHVLDEAKAHLSQLEQIAPEPLHKVDRAEAAAHMSTAEAALTSWYREWSGIARLAIESRGLRRQLGLVTSHAASSDELSIVESEGESVAPSPVIAGATNGVSRPNGPANGGTDAVR